MTPHPRRSAPTDTWRIHVPRHAPDVPALARWQGFLADLTDAGLLVANEGLSGTDAATTVRGRGGASEVTDGPVWGPGGS